MKNTLKLIYFGIFMYLMALLITIPAQVVIEPITAEIPNLDYDSLSGRAWKGEMTQVKTPDLSLSQLRWSFDALSLLSLRLGVALEAQANEFDFQGILAKSLFGSLHLNDVTTHIDIVKASKRWVKGLPISSGKLILNFDTVELNEQLTPLTLEGRGSIEQLKTLGIAISKLTGKIYTENEQFILEYSSDNSGDISLNGIIRLDAKFNFTLEGQLTLTNPKNTNISSTLRRLGLNVVNGKVRMAEKGNLLTLM